MALDLAKLIDEVLTMAKKRQKFDEDNAGNVMIREDANFQRKRDAEAEGEERRFGYAKDLQQRGGWQAQDLERVKGANTLAETGLKNAGSMAERLAMEKGSTERQNIQFGPGGAEDRKITGELARSRLKESGDTERSMLQFGPGGQGDRDIRGRLSVQQEHNIGAANVAGITSETKDPAHLLIQNVAKSDPGVFYDKAREPDRLKLMEGIKKLQVKPPEKGAGTIFDKPAAPTTGDPRLTPTQQQIDKADAYYKTNPPGSAPTNAPAPASPARATLMKPAAPQGVWEDVEDTSPPTNAYEQAYGKPKKRVLRPYKNLFEVQQSSPFSVMRER